MSRLDKLRSRLNLDLITRDTTSLKFGDIDWLIEQAERVEELERRVHHYEVVADGLHERSAMHRKYKKRYKQALETIELNTSDPEEHDPPLQFLNKIARQALAGDKDD